MDIKAFVLDAAQGLENGQTATLTCPVCGTRAKFTVTVKDDLVLYNCYRNSCMDGDAVPINLSAEDRNKATQTRLATNSSRSGLPISQETFIVPSYWIDGIGDDRCLKYMEENNMMTAYLAGLFRPMFDPAEQRFVFPIRDESKIVGAVGRTLTGSTMKAKNYNTKFDKPFVCGQSTTAILVEDCASAVAATRGNHLTGVALLGTNIRKEFIKYLKSYTTVYIALDKDAFTRSFFLKTLLTTYLKDVRIRMLDRDIKNMNDTEFQQWWQDNG